MKRVKKKGKNHTIKVDSMLCFNNSLRRYLLKQKKRFNLKMKSYVLSIS